MKNKLVFLILICLTLSIWYVIRISRNSPIHTADSSILIVGTNAEYAPFSFMNKGTIEGFDIDLINEIAQQLNKNVELQDMPFDALIPALQFGRIQLLIGGITPTAERAERAYFTQPYISGDPLLIITSITAPLNSIEQLKNKKVAVNEGYTADYYLSKIQGPHLIRFSSPIELFMALQSNQIDAIVLARSSAAAFLKHYGPNNFSVTEIPDTNEEYAIAISKKYPDLLEPIRKALDILKENGILQKLKEKWGLA